MARKEKGLIITEKEQKSIIHPVFPEEQIFIYISM